MAPDHRGPWIKSEVTYRKSVEQSKNRFEIDQLNSAHIGDEGAKRLEFDMENNGAAYVTRTRDPIITNCLADAWDGFGRHLLAHHKIA